MNIHNTNENCMFCMTIKKLVSYCSSSLIVHDSSDKKLYPDLKFIFHFTRNISDLKLKLLFLICGGLHLLFIAWESAIKQ